MRNDTLQWIDIKLEDICQSIDYGYTASAVLEPVGPKFLRITDIVNDYIDWASVPYCEIDDKKLPKYQVMAGDIVIARTGATTGYAKYIEEDFDAVFASYLVRIRMKPEIDSRYIGFIVESEDYKRYIRANFGGAAQPNANARVLTSYNLKLPPLEIQQKISNILNLHNQLISKNRRCIQILEEMGKAIYREWFVHFRLPGHEEVEMVDSEPGEIPEGWTAKKIKDAFDILGGGTPSTKKEEYWTDGDINWYTPSDLTSSGTMFMNDSGRKITELGLKKSSAKMFPPYSVMMTSRATLGVVSINTTPACTNQGFITCIPNENISMYQIYFWIKDNVERIISLGTGTTYKEIIKSVFREMDFIIPSVELKNKFEDVLSPMGKLILNLQNQNSVLSKTRNLLLPRLVSGEIDVSTIDIGVNPDTHKTSKYEDEQTTISQWLDGDEEYGGRK
ncbi:MAG: restriction endonuclease subunit S [Candidatus Thorarchaeota archaeon]